jgi:hypothetical protein
LSCCRTMPDAAATPLARSRDGVPLQTQLIVG